MRRLHLLRHAKSSWDDPALRDHDRPLAPRGRKAAKRVARWLATHEVRPELVVCSSAARAEETLERILPSLGDPEVRIDHALYAAPAALLLEHVRALPDDVGEAMLVGHNPGIADLLLLLARPGPLRRRAKEKVPAGALATLEADVARWLELGPGSAALAAYVVPRQLKT